MDLAGMLCVEGVVVRRAEAAPSRECLPLAKHDSARTIHNLYVSCRVDPGLVIHGPRDGAVVITVSGSEHTTVIIHRQTPMHQR